MSDLLFKRVMSSGLKVVIGLSLLLPVVVMGMRDAPPSFEDASQRQARAERAALEEESLESGEAGEVLVPGGTMVFALELVEMNVADFTSLMANSAAPERETVAALIDQKRASVVWSGSAKREVADALGRWDAIAFEVKETTETLVYYEVERVRDEPSPWADGADKMTTEDLRAATKRWIDENQAMDRRVAEESVDVGVRWRGSAGWDLDERLVFLTYAIDVISVAADARMDQVSPEGEGVVTLQPARHHWRSVAAVSIEIGDVMFVAAGSPMGEDGSVDRSRIWVAYLGVTYNNPQQ